MHYSIIVPTFKRPDEVRELLQSLTQMKYTDFEIILADGTPTDELSSIISNFSKTLNINHLHEPYLGISDSRNLGCKNAKGDYFIFFDSDCLIPSDYLTKVDEFIQKTKVDAYGGPDASHPSFTPIQKAISYSMTSLFTTGGIRGKKQHVGKFHPRGFNMGFSRKVFETTNGYSSLKCGEDIDLSIRIINNNFKTSLIPEAFVYHKRRTNLKQFFKQVFRFGAARINLWQLYKDEMKITHLFPFAFLCFLLGWLLSPIISFTLFYLFSSILSLYLTLIFIDSSIKNKSIEIGFLSIITVLVQFSGYGSGFFANFMQLIVLRKKEPIV